LARPENVNEQIFDFIDASPPAGASVVVNQMLTTRQSSRRPRD
jgi:hypothetical protein